MASDPRQALHFQLLYTQHHEHVSSFIRFLYGQGWHNSTAVYLSFQSFSAHGSYSLLDGVAEDHILSYHILIAHLASPLTYY